MSKANEKKSLRAVGIVLAVLMGSSLCFSAWAQEAPAETAIPSSVSQPVEETAESGKENQLVTPKEDEVLDARTSATAEESILSEASSDTARWPGNKEMENAPESLVLPEFYVMQEAQVLDLANPQNNPGHWSVDTGVNTRITIEGAGPYRLENSTSNYRLVIGANTTLILSDATIAISRAPVHVQSGYTLSLVLEGENTLTTSDSEPGIYVPAGAAVQISGEGSLAVTGSAGIGAVWENTGSITIAGGTVNAVGLSYYGTGIGGENAAITITGGTVMAKGDFYAAGIGGDKETSIVITGGNITAQGGYKGAGIGNSNGTGTATIEISGGVIHAISSEGGWPDIEGRPAIGGLKANITITDGEVTATADPVSGQGGGGIGATEGSITITGGTVDAVGGMSKAGIGGGTSSTLVTIEISGGIVNAIGGHDFGTEEWSVSLFGAGIGCSSRGNAAIRITGGEVTAKGSVLGSGIGEVSGNYRGNATVSITGGKVVAYGNGPQGGFEGSAGIGASEVTVAGVADVTSYGGSAAIYGGPGITAASKDGEGYNKLILDGTAHIVAVGGFATDEWEGFTSKNGSGIYVGYNQSIENAYPGQGRQSFYLGKDVTLEAYAKDEPAIHTLIDTTGDGYVQNNFYNPETLGDVTGFIATAEGTNARTALQQEIITLPAGYTAFATMSSAKGFVYDTNEEISRPLLASGISTEAIPGRQGNMDAYELVMAPSDIVRFFAGEAVGSATNMPHTQYVRKSNTGNYLLPQEVPAFPHYTFLGWLPNDGTGTLYLPGSTYKPLNSDVMFTAQWAANQYSIMFDGNGATAGSMENQTATYGGQINLNKNNFTRTGYDFVGWNTDKNALSGRYGDEGDYTHTADADVTLYAIWVVKGYGVSFNANNGSGEMAPLAIKYGETKLLPKNTFTRTGYDFVGWNTDENALSGMYADEGSYTHAGYNNVTLYAIWAAKGYGVSFNANNGSGEMAPLAIQYGETKLLPKNTFTRTGYDFVGWNTDEAALSGLYGDEGDYTQMEDSDVTLYAIWVAKGYGVSFNANNGSGEMAPLAIQYGETKLLPKNTFTRTGYDFVGWNTDVDALSGMYADESSYTQTGENDVTLYAIWVAKGYGVSFNANDGNGEMAPLAIEYGETKLLPKNTFTRAGYNFVGWAKTANAQTAEYANEGSYRHESDDNVILYAVWESEQTAGGGTTAPKTGDRENVALWGGLAAIAAAGTATLLLWRKKQGKPKI